MAPQEVVGKLLQKAGQSMTTLTSKDYEEIAAKYDNMGDYLRDLYEKEHVEQNLILYLAGLDEKGLEKAEQARKFLEDWCKIKETLDEAKSYCPDETTWIFT
jgi:coenzyme F420-reducing hydrogenase alpha subunit